MRASRALVAVAATGLAGVITLGAAAPASAATDTAAATASAYSAAGAAGSVALTASGGALAAKVPTPFPGKKPAAVLALAVRAMGGASSVHLRVHVRGDKSVSDLDFVLGRNAALGTITDSAAGTFQVLRVKSAVWMKADLKYWTAIDPQTAPGLAGRWIAVASADQADKDTRAMTYLPFWARDVSALKVTRRVAGKAVRRLPTAGLWGPGGTLYVAAQGTPYPLLLTSGPGDQDTETWFDWNKKVSFAPPKASTVLHL